MIEVTSKDKLDQVDGDLRFVCGVKSHVDAAAIAERRGYIAWFWNKRACRLYGMLPRAKNAEAESETK